MKGKSYLCLIYLKLTRPKKPLQKDKLSSFESSTILLRTKSRKSGLKTKKEIAKMKKDYEVLMQKEKVDNEVKLTKFRNSYTQKMKEETERFDRTLNELKETQTARLAETQMNNEQVIASQEEKHREYLEKARQRFEEEKAKIEA